MSLSVRCRGCGKTYANVPAKFAGKSIRCKECGESNRVPGGAAEPDPWDAADDEMEAPALPGRGGPPGRASKPAARRRRKPVPGWVWPTAAAGVVLALVATAAAMVDWTGVVRQVGLSREERLVKRMIAVQEQIVSAVVSVKDAASAEAAAARVRGPITDELTEMAEVSFEIEKDRRGMSPEEREKLRQFELDLQRKYEPRMKASRDRLMAESRRIAGLGESVARPFGEAMRDLQSRMLDIQFAEMRARQGETPQMADAAAAGLRNPGAARAGGPTFRTGPSGSTSTSTTTTSPVRSGPLNDSLFSDAPEATGSAGNEDAVPAWLRGRRQGFIAEHGADRVLVVIVEGMPRHRAGETLLKLRGIIGAAAANADVPGGDGTGYVFGRTNADPQAVADEIAFGTVEQVDAAERVIRVRWAEGGT